MFEKVDIEVVDFNVLTAVANGGGEFEDIDIS